MTKFLRLTAILLLAVVVMPLNSNAQEPKKEEPAKAAPAARHAPTARPAPRQAPQQRAAPQRAAPHLAAPQRAAPHTVTRPRTTSRAVRQPNSRSRTVKQPKASPKVVSPTAAGRKVVSPAAAPRVVTPHGTRAVTGSRLRGVPARGAGRTVIRGQNYSVWRSGYRVRHGSGWWTFVALSTLGAIAIESNEFYPYAYISAPQDYCEGLTEDGCELMWQDVKTIEGDLVPQCVAYCPWQ
jgi:hypothetical protein